MIDEEEYRHYVARFIREDLGITAATRGRDFLEQAVMFARNDPMVGVMELYQKVASYYHCKSASVEQMIRLLIEEHFERTRLNHYFPAADGKPSNAEIIWTVLEMSKVKRHREVYGNLFCDGI